MNITEVKIRLINKEGLKVKAIASITFNDCFAVHDIKVVSKGDGYYIIMPSRKTPTGEFKDIVHPLNNETRNMICKYILDEYHKTMNATQANA